MKTTINIVFYSLLTFVLFFTGRGVVIQAQEAQQENEIQATVDTVVDVPRADIFMGSRDTKLVSKAQMYMASSTVLDAVEATKSVLEDDRTDKIVNRLDAIIRILDKIQHQ